MKILLMSSNSSGSGGGEQYLVYLGRGLQQHGEQVIALISDRKYMDPWESRLADVGVEPMRADLIGLRDRPLRIYQSMRDQKQVDRIANICEEIKPDIIHVNQQYDADGLDYLMGSMKYGRAPVVGTIHMPMSITMHPRNPASPRTWLIALSGADHIKTHTLQRWYKAHEYEKIFPSQAMHNEFAAIYGETDHLHTITLGIDTDRMPLTTTLDRANVVGFCGRLEPQKDPLLMIDAWLKLLKNGTSTRLVIIGDGSLRKAIEEKLNCSAPAGSWTITGWVNNPQDYIKGIDVLVMSSRFEGLPLAAIEASCMGKRSIVVSMPAADELKKKIPYIDIVRSRDAASLSVAIAKALRSPRPDQNNIETVRSYFSCKRMAQDTLNLYKAIAKEG